MALKYVDGYGDFWTTNPGTMTSTSGVTVTASPSGYAEISYNGGFGFLANSFTVQNTYIVNTRVSISGIPSQFSRVHQLCNNGFAGMQGGLRITGSAKFQFNRGAYFQAGVDIGPQSPTSISLDSSVYYDIETKMTINTSGSIEFRLNGGVEIPPTSANTAASGNIGADSLFIGATASGGTGGVYRFRHAIVMDSTGSACNDFLGPVNVQFMPITGDGNYTDWAFTGAASAWQAVSETNPDTTSYIFDNTVGHKETFTHDPLGLSDTAVKATAVWIRATRDDSVTRAFKVLLWDSGDQLGGTEFFVGSGYAYFFQPFEVNPFSGVTWLVSEVNAVEVGVQVTT